MPVCTGCGGKRTVPCVKTIYDPYLRKQVPCPECGGTGQAICYVCGGSGQTP